LCNINKALWLNHSAFSGFGKCEIFFKRYFFVGDGGEVGFVFGWLVLGLKSGLRGGLSRFFD
jgi:hypothetical protein